MESASDDLKLGLRTLKLASERELMNCRSRVRRLSNGLPAFDSVWIDALVDQQLLTPFQGQFFEEKRWADLQIGQNYVLQGQIDFDRNMPLFKATHVDSSAVFFVSRLHFGQTNPEAAMKRLSHLTGRDTPLESDCCCPVDLHVHSKGGYVDVISPAVAGESLDRLLIRRGRFPEEVVCALAIEVCKRLQSLRQTQLHGDLRLANVMISTAGKVSLLNTGVLNAFMPTLNIHQPLPEATYDGIAPERFESSPEVTVASEMYSLGCLLWQLLAGRPPYAVADPLAKIAAHRQKQIMDVREIAPNCSIEFATLIQNLTSRRVLNRPESFEKILEMLANKAQRSQHRLREFIQSFESSAPHQKQPTTPRRNSYALKSAALVFLTILGIGVLWNREYVGIPNLTELSAATFNSSTEVVEPADFKVISAPVIEPEVKAAESTVEASHLFVPLPKSNAEGVIALDPQVVYHLSSIHSAEHITIRGAPGTGSTLIIPREETEVVTPSLRFENVNIEYQKSDQQHSAMLRVQTQELHLIACRINTEDSFNDASGEPLIDWQAVQTDESNAGRLLVSHCVSNISRPLIASNSPVSTVLFQNVLQQGAAPLLSLQAGAKPGLLVPIVLNQCTQNATAPMLHLHFNELFNVGGKISIQGNHSLFAAPQEIPLIGFVGSEEIAADWQSKLEISAQGLIVDQAALLFGVTHDGTAWTAIGSGDVSIDGVVSGKFHHDKRTATEDLSGISVPRFVFEELPVRTTADAPGFVLDQFQQARRSR